MAENPFARRLAWVTRLCLGSYFALLLLYLFKTVLIPMGGREANFTMWAVHSLPLLVFLPGMLRGNHRSYAWLSFAILMYFMVTVEALFTPDASIYHWVALVLVIVLFSCCVLLIRWTGMQHQWQLTHNGDSEGL